MIASIAVLDDKDFWYLSLYLWNWQRVWSSSISTLYSPHLMEESKQCLDSNCIQTAIVRPHLLSSWTHSIVDHSICRPQNLYFTLTCTGSHNFRLKTVQLPSTLHYPWWFLEHHQHWYAIHSFSVITSLTLGSTTVVQSAGEESTFPRV